MRCRWLLGLGLLFWLGASVAAPVQQEAADEAMPHCVTVTGSASTEGVDEAFARQMAIRNALTFASLNSNVSIDTEQTLEAYQLTRDATRFTSHSKVQGYQVVEEGYEESFDQYGEEKKRPLHYQVTLKVCLTENPSVCENFSGNRYQPRLAVAPVVVAKSYEARDIANLLPGFQTELKRRLTESGYRNLTQLDAVMTVDENGVIAPNLSPQVLDPVRDQTGAQFALLTVLRSLSSHAENHPILNPVKRFYNLEVKPDTRYLQADWYLVDLMNHTLFAQQRGEVEVYGDVRVGRDRPFGSNAFFATDTGKGFVSLLNQQVKDVASGLQCEPLQTQIIDVRNDEYVIYLNADSGAKVGDQLAVYSLQGRPVQFQGMNLGMDETPGAFIKIKRILPRFAVAEAVAKKSTIQVGDIVKTW
ncbi:flagellar assembly protein T N-terminal domain-containing protein [Thiomicrorhabdus cannonii]|uniref:flagellar assembly protein T N-terminal domain-containing protein n=1 Tax=Thiomicrorhabdus cannonii TaxID=2748011 RepID=UPI0015BA4B47|nr:flagellar assembly protein T N-terminal domain-containing protein [Thiomicrorhabdus cannonii]